MSSQEWTAEVVVEIEGITWNYLVASGFQDYDWGPFDAGTPLDELRTKGWLRVYQVYGSSDGWDFLKDKPPSDDVLLDAFVAQASSTPPKWVYDT